MAKISHFGLLCFMKKFRYNVTITDTISVFQLRDNIPFHFTSKTHQYLYPCVSCPQHLLVHLTRFTTQIEERVLWKLLDFLGQGKTDATMEQLDENSFESQRYKHILSAVISSPILSRVYATYQILNDSPRVFYLIDFYFQI